MEPPAAAPAGASPGPQGRLNGDPRDAHNKIILKEDDMQSRESTHNTRQRRAVVLVRRATTRRGHDHLRITVVVLALSFGLAALSPLGAQVERLRVLAATGSAEEVRVAIAKGADFNDCDGSGHTALMAAASTNHDPEVVAVLLRSGANVDAADVNGETALMYAAEYAGSTQVVEALLKAGAKLETRDRLGRTALIYAARSNSSLPVVTALLKAGANINAYDTFGLSPLMYAAWIGPNPAVVIALLSAGADAGAQSSPGRTLLQLAEDNPAFARDADALRRLQDAVPAVGMTTGQR